MPLVSIFMNIFIIIHPEICLYWLHHTDKYVITHKRPITQQSFWNEITGEHTRAFLHQRLILPYHDVGSIKWETLPVRKESTDLIWKCEYCVRHLKKYRSSVVMCRWDMAVENMGTHQVVVVTHRVFSYFMSKWLLRKCDNVDVWHKPSEILIPLRFVCLWMVRLLSPGRGHVLLTLMLKAEVSRTSIRVHGRRWKKHLARTGMGKTDTRFIQFVKIRLCTEVLIYT